MALKIQIAKFKHLLRANSMLTKLSRYTVPTSPLRTTLYYGQD